MSGRNNLALTHWCAVLAAIVLGAAGTATAAEPGAAPAADFAARCQALNDLDLEGVVADAPARIVTTALVVGKAASEPERIMFKKRGHSQGAPTPMLEAYPDHCRVEGYVVRHVRFRIVLPAVERWNGKFLLAACDGWCGTMHEEIVVPGLHRGYATLTNDSGHYSRAPFDGIWAHRNQPARVDFGHRANHVTALVGKAITAAFYGRAPRYSYITGFSKGGNAGLMAAQRYPEDFDGVFSKAPVVYYQWKNAAHFPWIALAVYPDGKTPVMDSSKVPLVHRAVLAACDGIDGLQDGIIDDPRPCRFDPAVLQCQPGQAEAGCLTAAQVESVRKVYAAPTSAAGEVYYPFPTDLGSDVDWANSIYPRPNSKDKSYSLQGAETGLRYMVFEDNPGSSYDWTQFDYSRERPRLAAMSQVFDPSSPDLRGFRDRGGKLLVVHGWADAMVSASMSIDWFEKMQRFMGGPAATAAFAQLYVVPGMQHGSGGSGPYEYDALAALEAWVEQGVAPDHLVMRDEPGAPKQRTRPVFPYPAKARYRGQGDPNLAESFERVQ